MSQPEHHDAPSHQAMTLADCHPADAMVAGDAAGDALRYLALLEAGGGLIWQADPDGRIRAVPTAGHVGRAAISLMQGHGWLTLFHPDDRFLISDNKVGRYRQPRWPVAPVGGRA